MKINLDRYSAIPIGLVGFPFIFTIFGIIVNDTRLIFEPLILVGLALGLVFLKRSMDKDDERSSNYPYSNHKYDNEGDIKSICDSWLSDEERNDPELNRGKSSRNQNSEMQK